MANRYTARWIVVDGTPRQNVSLVVVGDRIEAVEPREESDVDLGAVAIIPGLVNAHSHAFQRAIRGRTEWADTARPDENFWSWREQMYAAATTYGPEEVEVVSRWAFAEMALSGVTTVGEFHYLHHQPDGAPYDDPDELARRVISAARTVGIRIVLLRVAYQRGGHETPLADRQRRFVDPSLDRYLNSVDNLRRDYADDPAVTVGVAPHSIRAVDREWLRALRDHAVTHDLPLHIHANEQRREIEESIAEYGEPPVRVFEELDLFAANTTLVHATHLSAGELEVLERRGPTVCACPTTERNLGDGFLPADALVRRGVPIALGSDSHADIDLWQDARLVEYHERLQSQRRNVLAYASGAEGRVQTSQAIWPMLAEHGATSLGVRAGRLMPGELADFVTVDLRHPTMVGLDGASLLPYLCFAASPAVVRDVFVGGRPVVQNRSLPGLDDWADAFESVVTS